ncbi:hypothetical protein AB833_31160 [Chromatiales bacterium (ex Bugula neritina AB1)]|nr:hypothetical protein AB833_31160 [Chromatiales bacterium (ex Bugula neritina AB1)]
MTSIDTPATTGDTPIGFIGLGQMGAGMAAMLVSSGVRLMVFDVNPAAVSAMVAKGAIAAPGIAEISQQCEIVFMCVPGESEVEGVVFGSSGLLANTGCLQAIIDTSTVTATSARAFAGRVENEYGKIYCDCPVSGLPKRAADGSLTLMFGGSKQLFDSLLPVLSIMGKQVLHCGDIGSGQMMKAVNNIMYNINIAGFCEVLPLAVKAGLDPLMVESLLTGGSSSSFASEHFVPRILDRKFDGDFPMKAAYKDILNIQDIASEVEAHLPLVSAMVETYDEAIAAGYGGESKSAMIKVSEQRLGVTVRRSDTQDSTDLLAD